VGKVSPGIPPARDKTASELDEVERALSVLGGRHPDFVRKERETRDAVKARAATLEEQAARAARARLRRLAARGAVAAAALLVVVSVAGFTRHYLALRAGLEAASAPFESGGFARVTSSSPLSPHRLSADLAADQCFVAVTSAAAGGLVVHRGAGEMHGERAVGWCACAAEHVEATATDGATGDEGLRVLAVDARIVGGREGWTSSPVPKPDVVVPGGDETCAEADLVAWVAARRFPTLPVDAAWLDTPEGHPAARAGFRAVAGAPPGRRFAVVDAAQASCFLAVTAPASGAPLSLQEMDGSERARGAGLVWCGNAARAMTVRGDGAGTVLVAAADAARIGGLLGAREWASRGGVAAAAWEAVDDLAWDAGTLLRASAVGDVASLAAGDAPPPTTRIVGLAVHAPSGLVVEPGAGSNVVACAPPVEGGDVQAVCVLARAGASRWRPSSTEPVGLATAPLPFWMRAIEAAQDPEALRLELALVTLARRLHAQGFEPTTLEGVKEVEPGKVSVLGLAGDDGVVALEVAQASPWVSTYAAADAPGWSVEDDPPVVRVTPGTSVTLVTQKKPAGKPEQRRTVVFRRHAVR
jgi:hypothetical protein